MALRAIGNHGAYLNGNMGISGQNMATQDNWLAVAADANGGQLVLLSNEIIGHNDRLYMGYFFQWTGTGAATVHYTLASAGEAKDPNNIMADFWVGGQTITSGGITEATINGTDGRIMCTAMRVQVLNPGILYIGAR